MSSHAPLLVVPRAVRSRLPIIAAFSGAWFVGWAIIVHGTWQPLALDRRVDRPLQTLPAGWHQAAATATGGVGIDLLVVVTFGLVAISFYRRSWRAAVTVVVALGVESGLVEWVLKPLVDRHQGYPSGYSFPSGHTAAVAILATMLALLARRQTAQVIVALVLGSVAVAVMGVALVVAHAHYFSDVIAVVPAAVTLALTIGVAADVAADRLTRRSPADVVTISPPAESRPRTAVHR